MTDDQHKVYLPCPTCKANFDTARALEQDLADAGQRLNYLLMNFIESPDGKFTFPDGDTWECRKTVTIKDLSPDIQRQWEQFPLIGGDDEDS